MGEGSRKGERKGEGKGARQGIIGGREEVEGQPGPGDQGGVPSTGSGEMLLSGS